MHRTRDDQPIGSNCSSCLTRRTFVGLAGALSLAALPGCTVYEQTSAARGAPAAPPSTGTPVAKSADIPVGSGRIFAAANVVISQPTQGRFQAVSATCTHAGCQVSRVDTGTISCLCHGSQFALDGKVLHGPATSPLPTVPIRVTGGEITVG
jgi:Rieske Fe-S protein